MLLCSINKPFGVLQLEAWIMHMLGQHSTRGIDGFMCFLRLNFKTF